MLKSLKKPEKSRLTAVEKNVENFWVFNRQSEKKTFNREVFHFQHKNVESRSVYRRVLRFPVMSRMVAAMSEEGLLTSSSILRMEESTVV